MIKYAKKKLLPVIEHVIDIGKNTLLHQIISLATQHQLPAIQLIFSPAIIILCPSSEK